ncbi:hypothetical protein F1188_19180 [Roseospira marina]|uniref:Uncharacterized protein n=1 Tax=Roseospira marina TaxID=140057 RepID=A0A5M6I6P5_9PROT|nr:hypothetical protein [Roseospira marina]KAA5603783.1 hypothetical protein F1188_19180 [Roseospira marina]MBB4316091.1 hypothetical protein [Roseospira marina]MBB5089257.1 hypothetical protein [Roseospira marina]
MTAPAMVREALRLLNEGWPATAQFCAYDAGTRAGEALAPSAACPFDDQVFPALAAAWERGRSQTIAFQAGLRRSRDGAARPRLILRHAGGTHAAHAHPED